jgi:cytidyltransferase-like protein
MNLGEYLANLLLEQDQKTIALFPGAFKPPHKGHFAVVKDLADQADEVVVLISPKQREGISAEESYAAWELYDSLLPDNVSFKIAAESPVSETYDVVKNNPDTKFIVAFGKGEADRFKQFLTTNKYPNATVYDSGTAEQGVSATELRNALNNNQSIKEFIPDGISDVDFKNALNIKQQPLKESPPIEFEQDDYQDYIANNRAAIEKAAGYFNVPIPDMEYAFNAGQPVVLGDDVWSQLQNTNSFNIENLDHAIRYAHDKKVKVKPYILAIKNNEELPLPLILRYGQDKYWLVAGETILSLYKALKATPTVLQATLNLREVQTYIQPKPEKKQIIKEFIKYVAKELELTTLPRIKFSTDNEEVKNRRSFGYYNPGQNIIWVYTKNRNMADMLRTLAHELVHHKQNIDGRIYNNSGETGSEIENEANAKAGIILRNFGKQNNMIYEGKGLYPKVKIAPTPKGQFLQNADVKIVVVDEKGKTIKAVNELKEKYEIYCDMDGVLVDFERGYEELTGKNIRGNHVKGDADFWQPITDAGVEFWTKLKWMSDGKQLWNYIKKHKPSLLSAPSREESSRIGKHIWVENNIPGVNLILRAADKKQEFASPNAILIDDRADNIQRWKDAGGVGIHHISAENTINELEKLGL